MDIHCALCGEPWDTGSIRDDMTTLERHRFYAGNGCPSCGFGTICPTCRGTGRYVAYPAYHPCPTCRGSCYVILRRRVFADGTTDPANGRWAYGYNESYRTVPEPDPDQIIRRYPDTYIGGYANHQGPYLVQQMQVRCWEPACRESAPRCPICNGDGTFHAPEEAIKERRSDQFWWDCLESADA